MTESECRCGNPAMDVIKHEASTVASTVYYCHACGRLKYVDRGVSIAGGLFGAGSPKGASVTWREPALLQKLAEMETSATTSPEEEEPKAEEPKAKEPKVPEEPPPQNEVRKFKTRTVELVDRLKAGEFFPGAPQEPNQESDDEAGKIE